MAGPAEDHAAAEITADADHVGTMISAAGEPRVVRVAHVTTAMTDRAGRMDRGVMIGRVTTGMTAVPLAGTTGRVEMTGLVETNATVTTGMSVALLAVTIARAEMIDRAVTPGLVAKTDPDAMMTSAVGERRVATADPVMNVTTDCAEIRDRAAVFGTVQLRPHRSVRAIRIRSVPLRSKCLAKFANQTLMRTWCFPTCCASSASWAGTPVSRQN